MKERTKQDFLGGPVVKTPPANAGDMDLIPGPGKCHMLQGQLSLWATTLSPQAATTEACAA